MFKKIKEFLIYLRWFFIYQEFYPLQRMKFCYQRIMYGFSTEDLWSLDWFIIKKIRKPFKAFVNYEVKHGYGCPEEFFDKDIKGNQCIRWIEALKKIELSFDLMYEEEMGTKEYFKKSTDQHIEDNKKIQEGLDLFGKYFQDLWD